MFIYTRRRLGFFSMFSYLPVLLCSFTFLFVALVTGHSQNQEPCGFEKNYPELNVIDGSLSEVIEDASSFQLNFESITRTALTNQSIVLSSTGDLLNQRTVSIPLDTFIRTGIIEDSTFIYGQGASDSDPERVVILNKEDFQGNILLQKKYPLPSDNEIFSIGTSSILSTSQNYILSGPFVDVDTTISSVLFMFYVIRTDKEGNLISLNTYPAPDVINPQLIDVDDQDNIYIQYQTSSRTGHVVKLNADGIIWDQSIIGDLVSNRIYTVELSNDETEVIITGLSSQRSFIRRLDVETGETISSIFPSDIFTPDDFTTNEFGTQSFQTQDGGMVISYNFFSTNDLGSGIEYGRLDSNGNALWSNRLMNRNYNNIQPIAETADGGFLFQNINQDNQLVILKTTATGGLFPVCGQASCQAEGGVDGIITFNSQAEVDAFGPCDVYDGAIAIAGADITNVDALNGLREITGGLFIRRTATSLESLEGLNTLISVGKGIEIAGNLDGGENVPLKNLDGLRNLVSVGGGSITVIGTLLESVEGLSTIERLDRRDEENEAIFQFIRNTELTTIKLPNFRAIDGSLTIAANPKLKTIDLPRLGSIEGKLFIEANAALDSVNLRAIFDIGDNATGDRTVLSIADNPSLEDCCFISRAIDRLNEQDRGVNIRDNGATCAQAATIQQVCKDCPQIITNLELPDSVKTGDLVTIVATVQNAGLIDAGPTNIGLYSFFGGSRQPGPMPVLITEFPIEGLAIGEERTFTFEEVLSFRNDPENVSAGQYALLFRPDSISTNLFQLRNCETELNFTVKPQIADLALSLEGSDCIDSTGELQADIVVTNAGSDSIIGPITLSFNSPPSPTAIIADDERVRTISGTTFRTRNGDLAPGESLTFSRPFFRPSVDSTEVIYGFRFRYLDVQDTNPDNNNLRQKFFKRADCQLPERTCSQDYIFTSQAEVEKDCQDCICPDVETPVCGSDGITYANSCKAECAGIEWSEGNCDEGETFIDLEIDLTTADPNPAIYTRLPLTVSIANKGNTTAENIRINLTICDGGSSGFQQSSNIVYATTRFTASAGSYEYLEQNWTIPLLEAGASASLTVELFTLSEDPINIGAFVFEASPNDIDSTPDRIQNVNACVIDEDDEDDLILNGIVLCDCPGELDPVCGSDGITYANPCEAECLGVTYEQGECKGLGGEITCGEITITYGNGKIDIVGERGNDYFFKVHRRLPIWEYVFECNGKCGFGQTASGLADGTYYVDVYDKSWHLLCDDIEVKLDGGRSTMDGERVLPIGLFNELSSSKTAQLLVYPNPATDLVHIDLMNTTSNQNTIIVTDNFGRVIKNITLKDQVSTTFSLANFMNGIYQISRLSENKIIGQQRLVVLK